jgi:bacterioferritin-associated ferredoxin
MLVCQCNGVTDRTIRRAVRKGARTTEDVGYACGAGACCGGCIPLVEKLIRHEAARSEAQTTPPTPANTAQLQQ